MALADQIHWSFQYDGRSQAPLFGKRLIEIMQDATVAELTDESAVVDRYLVLPIGAGGAEYYDPAITHACVDFLTSYEGDDPLRGEYPCAIYCVLFRLGSKCSQRRF